jgi:hypothetical protein
MKKRSLTRKLSSWLAVSAGARALLRLLISWFAVALGGIVGFIACARFGMAWAPVPDHPAWYLGWFDVAGVALLGLGFLFASFAALRNRGLAGIIFLSIMPVAGFCLAYPNAGYLVWRSDGGWFETPIPAVAIGLASLFYAVFLVPVIFWPRKKRAAIAFASAALVAGPIFAYSRWTVALLPRLVAWSSPFLLLGLFWLRTDKLGWPSLLQPASRSLAKRVLAFVATCVGILCLCGAFMVTLAGLGSSLFSPDCRGRPPFVRPRSPTHAVFTAKILFAGRSIDTLVGSHGGLGSSSSDHRVGDWAIGLVQERFWGVPHWTRLVLLTNYVYWEGETYFVDGTRLRGLLTQFLPIVEGGVGCSRTKPAQNAIIDLRLLRKLPVPGATRVIGYVRGPEPFTPGLTRPSTPNFVAGALMQLTGPSYSRIVRTDSAGVYELDNLAPGDYILRLSTLETQVEGFFSDSSTARIHLESDGVVEKNFELFWNGRIEGQVTEDGGKPAHAWVELLSADGRPIPGYVNFFEMTARDGSYQFRKVPPGLYIVIMNPNGPSGGWPYDFQYFPSGVRKDKARVFELAPGQRMAGINFQVPRLPERNAQLRVTWTDGRAAAGAPVCIAYTNTDDYESLVGKNCIGYTDQNGLAMIHTYGKSELRLFAEQFVYHDNRRWPDRFHSRPVQSGADQIPNIINLVLTSESR